MADKTGIEWADATWNPIRGCQKVSEGCANCYAERMAIRFSGVGLPYFGLTYRKQWNGAIRFQFDKLDQPIRWKRPRRVFVCSMSDLFHEAASFPYVAAVFGAMAASPQHTFQVLTKRPRRMLQFFRWLERETAGRPSAACCVHHLDQMLEDGTGGRVEGNSRDPRWRAMNEATLRRDWPLRNVWIGVSAENQDRANERIPLLLEAPAAVRWISLEPLIGPVDLERIPDRADSAAMLSPLAAEGLGWIVVGGETGPGWRPCFPAWVRAIRDQAAAAGVPFFFKGWGASRDQGRELDGEILEEYPEPPRFRGLRGGL